MPSRLMYRQAAARTLGSFYTGTATSGSTTSILEATAWPFKSTLLQNERFEQWLVHRPSAAAADRVRAVPASGYNAIAGQFSVDQAWSAAPYAAGVGEAFELLGLLDPDTLHRLINDALKLCTVNVEFSFTPASATAYRHSLGTAAPWLTDPDQVYQVGYLAPGDSRSDVDPFRRPQRGKPYERQGVVYLEGFAQPITNTVYVLARRSAYTYCRPSSGAYGDLTTGLTAETDEGLVEEDWVAAGVKMLAWDEFREILWPGEMQTAEQKVAVAAARFWRLVRDNWSEPERTFLPLRAWGPTQYARTPV